MVECRALVPEVTGAILTWGAVVALSKSHKHSSRGDGQKLQGRKRNDKLSHITADVHDLVRDY